MPLPTLRSADPQDAASICAIYDHYIANTIVTFEEQPVPHAEMAQRIAGVLQRLPWLVAEEDDAIVGYAYATPWRSRVAYRFAAETTVYLAPDRTGRGVGSRLYQALIDELKARGLHVAIGGIALPNPASLALHERLGFEKVAHFREVGWKLDRWVDVGYWQLRL